MKLIRKLKVKLLIKLSSESLLRARKRINTALKQSANEMIYTNIIKDGVEGYKRERSIYG